MKNSLGHFSLVVALYAITTSVSARPLDDLGSLVMGDRVPIDGLINRPVLDLDDNEPIKRDNDDDPEKMINRPFLEYDDEPVKRDEGATESAAMINTPFLIPEDENELLKRVHRAYESEAMRNTSPSQTGKYKRQMRHSPILNQVTHETTHVSRNQPKIDNSNKDVWLVDRDPTVEEGKKEKRRIPSVNSMTYFSGENTEESDRSEDVRRG